MKKHLTVLILAVALVSTASATQHQSERVKHRHFNDDHRRESRQGATVNVPETGATLPLLAMGLGALFIVGRNQGKTVNSI